MTPSPAVSEPAVRRWTLLALAGILILSGERLTAQQTFDACYVPSVGAIYLINQTDLPTACLAESHVAISWTEGGALADGSVTAVKLADGSVVTLKLADGAVTEVKLGFDPATQAELETHAGSGGHDGRYFTEAELSEAGTINEAGNPVDWTRLKGVPADFADGVDNTGGTSSDVECAGCVGEAELADAAVTTGKIAVGAVTEAHLVFDPVTETELDVHGGSADHDGRYFTEAELSDAGTINTAGNPVAWTRLQGVPPSFADGVDDAGATDHGALTGLTNDDHGQYLLLNGVRDATDGFAVTGTFNAGTIPATGDGVRVMWYPRKAAFRAGRVTGSEWDDANVGFWSIAMGGNTTAAGGSSTAMGFRSTASGNYSTATGLLTTASGQASTATGYSTTASGNSSTATGSGTSATGSYSTAMGISTTATGGQSTAMGAVTTAQAAVSLVIGKYNVVQGSTNSWVSTDPLFVAGNGTSTSPSNALTLYKNGNLTIAGTLAQSSDIRLKEDVEPVESTLDAVLELTPIRYRFRAGTGHPSDRQIGLSAQQVERLFPELVARDSRGYLSVAYADLATVLVRAVQEQQATIETLLERIERLEGLLGGTH